ncbi:MAG TPA: hypothetical protein VKB93_24470 [Thermoanaerobaculia bacterium]|nr:hypothetical protein [Thermoanaerobaculia bacterium]
MSTSLLRRPAARFALTALFVMTACIVVLRSRAFAANPDVAAWGVTFDLTITIPLLYWFFVVRRKLAGPLTLATLFVVCTMVAAVLIPRPQQFFLHDLKYFVAALEVVLITTAVRHIGKGEGRMASLLLSEAAVMQYALTGWWREAERVEGRAITFHERSGWGSIVACAIVLIASEGIAAHLFLATWKPTIAWAWTGLDLWGALWFLGDYHALRLRRSWLDSDALHLRVGLRWSATIELANIESIEPIREWTKRKDALKVAFLDEPRWLITLREPVVVDGIAGIRKTVRALALLPDDDQFVSDVQRACESNPSAAPAARP